MNFKTEDGVFNESWASTIYDTESMGGGQILRQARRQKIDISLPLDEIQGIPYKDAALVGANN